MTLLRDAIGVVHAPAPDTARIACLVPSITELVCDLGLAAQLVARTGFCIHPREAVAAIPKAGGTKDVDIARLRALAPTHVIVNIDENNKAAVEEIASFVPHVIVTHPNAPEDNVDLYRLIGGIFDRAAAAEELCNALRAALAAALRGTAGLPRQNVLYLIWKDPWMTVAPDTYISRTLAAVGWDTVAAVAADAGTAAAARYPQLSPAALTQAAGAAAVVLLSTEPYMFRAPHVAALQAQLEALTAANAAHQPPSLDAAAHQSRSHLARAAAARVMLIDGEMTSWYGSRAIAGLAYLARLRADGAARAA